VQLQVLSFTYKRNAPLSPAVPLPSAMHLVIAQIVPSCSRAAADSKHLVHLDSQTLFVDTNYCFAHGANRHWTLDMLV
jgi:hypothetical protein